MSAAAGPGRCRGKPPGRGRRRLRASHLPPPRRELLRALPGPQHLRRHRRRITRRAAVPLGHDAILSHRQADSRPAAAGPHSPPRGRRHHLPDTVGPQVLGPTTLRGARLGLRIPIAEYFACHSGARCLRLYPQVSVLRMVVVKRVMNRHRVRMLRMRVTEVLSAAVTGVALSAPCSPVRAGCRGLT